MSKQWFYPHGRGYNQQHDRGIHGRDRWHQTPDSTWQQGNNFTQQPKPKVVLRNLFEFFDANSFFGHRHPVTLKLENTTFNCVEQFILCKKADKFKENVMKATPSNIHKYTSAENYETEEWYRTLQDVAERGNQVKFSQNPKLRALLLKTNPRKLVHVGQDTFFGIGLNKNDPESFDERNWRGKNTLGKILTRIRENLLRKGLQEAQLKYEYFWQKHSPYSQWFSAMFLVDGYQFNCTEQYMMYKKAVLFQDWSTAEQIMKEKRPYNQKALGRKVRSFNEHVWNEHCERIVEEGNMAKFSQNQELKQLLLATHPRPLVEASPKDQIWGIGLEKDNPLAWDERTWRGKNLLGKALTRVRCRMMTEKKMNTKRKEIGSQRTTLSDEDIYSCVHGSTKRKAEIQVQKGSHCATLSDEKTVTHVDDKSKGKMNERNEEDDSITVSDEELLAVDLPMTKKDMNEKERATSATLSGQDKLVQGNSSGPKPSVSVDVNVVRESEDKGMTPSIKAKEEKQKLRKEIFKQTQAGMNKKLKRLPETNQEGTIAEENIVKKIKLEDVEDDIGKKIKLEDVAKSDVVDEVKVEGGV